MDYWIFWRLKLWMLTFGDWTLMRIREHRLIHFVEKCVTYISWYFLDYRFMQKVKEWSSKVHNKCWKQRICDEFIPQLYGKINVNHFYGSSQKIFSISLAPMGVLAPGSGHARPSLRPPIDTSGIFLAHMSGGGEIVWKLFWSTFSPNQRILSTFRFFQKKT